VLNLWVIERSFGRLLNTVLYSRVSDDFLSAQESRCQLPPFC
jgi:hypothetical protein